MTYFSLLNQSFTIVQYLEFMLRILVAAGCGALIGLERSHRFKDAGFRTHCLVAAASALIMIVSKYGFADLGAGDVMFSGTRGADPARLAAQVVSGISFLCAGVIYKDKNAATRGLTTAAGVWAVAGIGLSIGSGMYAIGLFVTVFILVIQMVMHRHPVGADRFNSISMVLVMQDNPETLKQVHDQIEEWGIMILSSQMKRMDHELIEYSLAGKSAAAVDEKKVAQFVIDHPAIHSMHVRDDT